MAGTTPPSEDATGGPAGPTPTFERAGTRALVVLTLINMLNYVDRYVVPPVFESLRKDPAMGRPSDAALGWLMTGFLIVYTVASPIFGTLGDRRPRLPLMALGIGIWSIATATGGLATSFAMLLLARATVGIGEASYQTIAPAVLADYYPRAVRGRVMSIFNCAIPVGSALGFVLGGLADAHFGWRAAFFIAGTPGLVLALVALSVDDPPRGAFDGVAAAAPGSRPGVGSFVEHCRALAANRPYLLTSAGYAAYTFALGGIAAWLPSFFERVRGIPHEEASSVPGAILVITGLVGTFAGGWLGDRLLPRTRQAHLWVSGVATLAAAPVALVLFTASSPAIFWSATVLAEVLLFASTGLVNAVTVNVVPPTMRATALALQVFLIHALGDVPSPVTIGLISDAWSLQKAMLIVPVAVVLSGLIWMHAARRGET